MADITTILEAVATRVKTITSLANRASAFGKDFVDPPWAIVVPEPGEFIHFDSTLARGSDDLSVCIKVLVGAATDRVSQQNLNAYLATSGASSIKAAVDGDLGGAVHFATVRSARNYGDVEWGGAVFNGVEFAVEVCA